MDVVEKVEEIAKVRKYMESTEAILANNGVTPRRPDLHRFNYRRDGARFEGVLPGSRLHRAS